MYVYVYSCDRNYLEVTMITKLLLCLLIGKSNFVYIISHTYYCRYVAVCFQDEATDLHTM